MDTPDLFPIVQIEFTGLAQCSISVWCWSSQRWNISIGSSPGCLLQGTRLSRCVGSLPVSCLPLGRPQFSLFLPCNQALAFAHLVRDFVHLDRRHCPLHCLGGFICSPSVPLPPLPPFIVVFHCAHAVPSLFAYLADTDPPRVACGVTCPLPVIPLPPSGCLYFGLTVIFSAVQPSTPLISRAAYIHTHLLPGKQKNDGEQDFSKRQVITFTSSLAYIRAIDAPTVLDFRGIGSPFHTILVFMSP